jgi:hypothetical protein
MSEGAIFANYAKKVSGRAKAMITSTENTFINQSQGSISRRRAMA